MLKSSPIMIPRPLIYAELLSNIRQISVIVALPKPCGPHVKVELSADGRQFILVQGGDRMALNLPGQVALNVQLQKPAIGSQELSWRLPVAGFSQRPDLDLSQSNDAPWSAKSLSNDMEFLCRDCGFIIIKKGVIKEWRDLPSENWAEMMDFWHCHKPSDEEHSCSGGNSLPGSLEAGKGYGANTKFTAQSGIGFVDLTTFLIAYADCPSIQVNTRIPSFHRPLRS